jgi:F-type H+-transporting ATPase subunit b
MKALNLVRMRRLFLVLTLTLAGATLVCAQDKAAEEKHEKAELGIGWKWANFAILAVALGYLASKNLPVFFQSRTQEIQKGISEAQKIKQDAEKRAAAVEARMQTLGTEIETFRTQSKSEMQQEGERIRQETAHQISRMEAQAQQEIESASKVATRDLKAYAAKLALDLAEQRVRTRLDGATSQILVDGFIQDLSRQESKN